MCRGSLSTFCNQGAPCENEVPGLRENCVDAGLPARRLAPGFVGHDKASPRALGLSGIATAPHRPLERRENAPTAGAATNVIGPAGFPTKLAALPGPPPDPNQIRSLLGRGVLLINWGTVQPGSAGVGRITWSLGIGLRTKDGVAITFKAYTPLWSSERAKGWWASPTWLPVIHWGHIMVPVFYLAARSALPPAGVWVWRRFAHIPPGCCKICRYDLRGTFGVCCPECGRPIKAVAVDQFVQAGSKTRNN